MFEVIKPKKQEAVIKVIGEELVIITEKTCFYGESGGQVGDTGTIKSSKGEFLVTDTRKTPQGIFIHFGKLISGRMKVGDSVDLSIDKDRRSLIMKNHSATQKCRAKRFKNILFDKL